MATSRASLVRLLESLREAMAGGAPMTREVADKVIRLFREIRPREKTKDKPKEVEEIISAVTAGNFKEAQKVVERIGITEDYFVRQGGGLWALVIVIGIGCALLLAHD